MLVRSDSLIVGQPAHAWVSGQLARAWGNEAFPPPAPREPVCLAAEQHDVGWADADLAPLLGDDGRPRSFIEYPRPAHLAIWAAAPRRLLAQSRYAALLASLHGTSLYERIAEDSDAIREYKADQRALQAELSAGIDPAEVDRNRRLLLAWDALSLALCHERGTTLSGVPAAGGEADIRVQPAAPASAPTPTRFTVAPWPFTAEPVVVGCEARRLPGTFADEAALHAALATAPWVPLRWELRPG